MQPTWQQLRRVPVAFISCLQPQKIRMAPQLLQDRKTQMSKHNRNRQLASLPDNATEPQRNEQADGSIVSEDVNATRGEPWLKSQMEAAGLSLEDFKPKPRVTTFVPKDCTSCTALRASDPVNNGRSFSRVYSTQGRTRYCKCGYCGFTWKEVE